METTIIILRWVQYVGLIAMVACFVKAQYHWHQADRILDRKGKQTFWQWVRRIDTPRGTGIWK
jgi:hypothetical protein